MSLQPLSVRHHQERLDVVYKTRANLFNWRGQFTPQFVDYLLDEYATQETVVADPFSGSGTVLLECTRRNLTCFGLEINPAAFAMSKFYTLSNMDLASRVGVLDAVERGLVETVKSFSSLMRLTEDAAPHRQRFSNLIDFTRRFLPRLHRGIEKIVALNLLFLCESRKGNNADLSVALLDAFVYIKNAAISLPYSPNKVSVFLQDARSIHTASPVRPNLIITSPPYINVFNYHQNHRAILEAVGWNLLKVAPSEFGSNRKNRGNRFRTVIQYCLDIEDTLRGCWASLAAEGKMVFVVGRESNVRDTPFYNGEIVRDVAESLLCFEMAEQHERQFSNKFGQTIREDVFLFQKRCEPPVASDVRKIAIKHLSLAFSSASPEVKDDIAAAILECRTVTPSPVFNAKEAYAHA